MISRSMPAGSPVSATPRERLKSSPHTRPDSLVIPETRFAGMSRLRLIHPPISTFLIYHPKHSFRTAPLFPGPESAKSRFPPDPIFAQQESPE
jgi:hypothetical protein